ncbi:MAG: hypothetical protein GY821_05070 [Gammaproteobacteria bacterium]|nr:hypothetical protein [Gammaproteobacteria bacterium]
MIEKGLILWGNVTRLERGESLNYSSKNSLAALSELGTRIATNHRSAIAWQTHLAQLDQMINTLGQTHPKWGQALMHHYTQPGNLRQQANQCGLPKSTFHERLQKARQWLGVKIRQHTPS